MNIPGSENVVLSSARRVTNPKYLCQASEQRHGVSLMTRLVRNHCRQNTKLHHTTHHTSQPRPSTTTSKRPPPSSPHRHQAPPPTTTTPPRATSTVPPTTKTATSTTTVTATDAAVVAAALAASTHAQTSGIAGETWFQRYGDEKAWKRPMVTAVMPNVK
jgi:hypothetical protein